ncbi:hypothetical protein CA284_03645 [Enterobacter mori]|nr:hypothetical protein CA284_03645 [Enterobacter mori]
MRWLDSACGLAPSGPAQALFKLARPVCPRSPQSRTYVRSWGFAASPPSCNSNYLGYKMAKSPSS